MATPNAATLQWAQWILEALGAVRTQTNMKIMVGWIVGEHGWQWNGAGNNPMNTTLHEAGSTNFNSVGVQSYPSVQEGVRATVSTLEQNSPSYATLVTALKNSDYNLFFSPQGTAELNAWGGSDTYAGYIKSVVDSVGTIPEQYLKASGVTVDAGPVLQKLFSELDTGANDLANLLGLNKFIKPGANTKSIIVGAGIAALILWLIAEGASDA